MLLASESATRLLRPSPLVGVVERLARTCADELIARAVFAEDGYTRTLV